MAHSSRIRFHPCSRSGRLTKCFALAVVLLAALPPLPAHADCTLFCDDPSFLDASEAGNVAGDTDGLGRCSFGSKYCETPVLRSVRYTLDDPDCDPYGSAPCGITAESEWHFPGNGDNACFQGITINAGWLLEDANCGLSVTGTLDSDLGVARAHYSATCDAPGSLELRAIACQGTP